jgi:hypothetical protein
MISVPGFRGRRACGGNLAAHTDIISARGFSQLPRPYAPLLRNQPPHEGRSEAAAALASVEGCDTWKLLVRILSPSLAPPRSGLASKVALAQLVATSA